MIHLSVVIKNISIICNETMVFILLMRSQFDHIDALGISLIQALNKSNKEDNIKHFVLSNTLKL